LQKFNLEEVNRRTGSTKEILMMHNVPDNSKTLNSKRVTIRLHRRNGRKRYTAMPLTEDVLIQAIPVHLKIPSTAPQFTRYLKARWFHGTVGMWTTKILIVQQLQSKAINGSAMLLFWEPTTYQDEGD
jgi:hypothetical protein